MLIERSDGVIDQSAMGATMIATTRRIAAGKFPVCRHREFTRNTLNSRAD
jgi:hypothetical protein